MLADAKTGMPIGVMFDSEQIANALSAAAKELKVDEEALVRTVNLHLLRGKFRPLGQPVNQDRSVLPEAKVQQSWDSDLVAPLVSIIERLRGMPDADRGAIAKHLEHRVSKDNAMLASAPRPSPPR